MDKTKKVSIIIIVVLIIIVIIALVVKTNKKAEKTEKTPENKIELTEEEKAIEIVTSRAKEKLEKGGLILEDRGKATHNISGTEGKRYDVYIEDDGRNEQNKYMEERQEVETSEIEIYMLDGKIIREIGLNVKNGETIIAGEKYWLYENIIIKQCENENINKIIKNTMK